MIKHYKDVVIEVSMEPRTIELLKELKDSPVIANADNVHFMCVFNESQKKYLPLSTDDCKDLEKVENHIISELAKLQKSVMNGATGKNRSDCKVFFSKDAKIKALDYLRDISADLVIVASHGEDAMAGLINETFSVFLAEHSPSDVYIIKPQAH